MATLTELDKKKIEDCVKEVKGTAGVQNPHAVCTAAVLKARSATVGGNGKI